MVTSSRLGNVAAARAREREAGLSGRAQPHLADLCTTATVRVGEVAGKLFPNEPKVSRARRALKGRPNS
ncbi:hypothetical protein MAFF212519_02410 [Clavibacter michiganensis]